MTTALVYRPFYESLQATRVLIFSDAAPHRNGVGAYYADLIDDLAEEVEEIKMISPEVVGNEWHGAWMLPLPGDTTQKLCIPNVLEISRRMAAYRPSVVIIPTPGPFGLLGAFLARKQGIPVICGFHTWFEKLAGLYWKRVQGGVMRRFFEYVNRVLFRFSDLVLANSHEMVGIARNNGAENVHLMGTPISRAMQVQPLPAVPKVVRHILFIGRLAAEKNVASILTAARTLPNMTFTIAGEGPEKKRLQQQAKGLNNVTFHGWVDREQVIALLDGHDALVLPSTVESFGTVAMEAMMRQRLVITSNACGITEWPELRQGLNVIPEQATLDQFLRQCSALSEFEIFRRCHLARKKALAHVQWNRELWLSHVCQLTFQDSEEVSLPFLEKLSRTVRR